MLKMPGGGGFGLMKNKKGGFELSMTTVVVLVIAMTMLVLGIVLVRQIFGAATSSVNVIDENVRNQINDLFAKERKNVVISLGSDYRAKIKAGTPSFGIAFAARTKDGSATNRERLTYTIGKSTGDCIRAEDFFIEKIGETRTFDEYEGDTSRAIINLKVPDGTAICTQKFEVDVFDTEADSKNRNVGGSFFIVEIVRGGIFG